MRLFAVALQVIAVALCLAAVTKAAEPEMRRQPRSLVDDVKSPFSPRWTPNGAQRFRNGPAVTTVRPVEKDAERRRRRQAAAASTTTGASSSGPRRMIQLAFMHRHGARTGPEVHGSVLSWDMAHLSEVGATMAKNLGRQLRRWYPTFIDAAYDRDKFHSVSTDVERTIRTGYGVISGVFNRTLGPLNNFSVPYLRHRTLYADARLGYYYSWVAGVLHQPQLLQYNVDSAQRTLSYLSPANLSTLGQLTGASAICDNATLATTCALFAEDYGLCKKSNEGISDAFAQFLTPTTLLRSQAESNYNIYGLNLTRSYVRGIGPYGMIIISDILDQFDDALAQLAANSSMEKAATPVYHYSAHDITLYGFFVALGLITAETTNYNILVPTFASIARLELYSDATVTFRFSHCKQAFDSGYAYSDDATVQLRCMHEDGTAYSAATCPVADLRRMVASLNISKASNPDCYADPVDVEQTRCAPWMGTSVLSPSDPMLTPEQRKWAEYCLTYRRVCAAEACDTSVVTVPGGVPSEYAKTKYALNRATLQCVPVYDFRSQAAVPAPALVATFFGLACFTTFALLAVTGFYCAAKASAARAARVDSEEDALVRDTVQDPSGTEGPKSLYSQA